MMSRGEYITILSARRKLVFAHAMNIFFNFLGSSSIIACGDDGKFTMIGAPTAFAITMAGNSTSAPIGNIQRLTLLE